MLKPVKVFWGADPEGFFERGGKIIGSEKVLPEGGLGKDVVLDGVQFELNPQAMLSPSMLGNNIKMAFTNLKAQLLKVPEVKVCFNGLVEIDREELDSLSESSRILGCKPSKNIYGLKPIDVDPLTYRKRSAAGHIHMGLGNTKVFNHKDDERQKLVAYDDIFVGNTCVMLDRDPGAAERRENYGRAGEFRLPDYGLEYRTLSNFWLKNYTLQSLVFGLAHIAVSAVDQGKELEDELVEVVSIDKFIEAINTNNYDLARDNFLTIEPFLVKHLPKDGPFPLEPGTLRKFLEFTDAVKAKGLESFFPENPVDHWVSGKFVEFKDFLKG